MNNHVVSLQAEAIALTVAQAFTMAYEEWDEKSKERQREVEDEQASDALELYKDLASESPKPDANPFKKEEPEDDFNFISNSLAPRVETIVSLLELLCSLFPRT